MGSGGSNFINMVGRVCGELTVIRQADDNKQKQKMWVCICSCGKEKIVNGSYLRSGHTKTCGHASLYCKRGHLRTSGSVYPNSLTCKECQKVRRSVPEVHEKNLIDHRVYYERNGNKCRRETRARAVSLKTEALTHYGPQGVLGCCWEGCFVDDIDMLSLDHVNNDGAEHRRRVGKNKTGEKMYRLVKQEGFPEGFQTLCMNHQTKKKLLNVRSKYE